MPFIGEIAALTTSLFFSVGPTFFTLAGRLVGMNCFARRVVVDRWFLHARQPALLTADAAWRQRDAREAPTCTGVGDLAEARLRR